MKVKEYITAGESIQVVLSQRLAVSTDAAPFDIYRALRTINPSPYMFFLQLGDFHILGALAGNTGQGGWRRCHDTSLAGTAPAAPTRSRTKLWAGTTA